MKYQNLLRRLLLNDPERINALSVVQSLNLKDGWIGAGFVRDAVWAYRHGFAPQAFSSDVDVIWFDPEHCHSTQDRALEATLNQLSPTVNWSVKNQARMHQRNGDAPYLSTADAIQYWPETATAVAVRLGNANLIEIIAPYGLDDLFELRLRPTPRFEREKRGVFSQRVAVKRWQERYPLLQVIVPGE